MRSRDPFGVVLSELRVQIRQGAFPEGAPLLVTDLAAALGVSPTPVREALAYLAGEGLIDGRHGQLRGYQVWRTEPAVLADLLRLHQAQLLAALSDHRSAEPALAVTHPASDAPDDLADFAERLFAGWVEAGSDGPLRRAHRLVADRLRRVRLCEGTVLGAIFEELTGLAAAPVGTQRVLALRAYHRRRLAVAPRLSGRLRSWPQGHENIEEL